jgi:tRNA(Arg) A34 adenosine deaminase TadA
MDAEGFMRRAIELSREKLESGAGGYCATLVVKDGEVVGEGWTTVLQANDPTAHCEINAMRAAGQRLGTWDLSGCELYTTWEPCPMCVAAIWWARVDRVYYANLLSDAADLGSDVAGVLDEARAPVGERSRPYERLLGAEALAVVKDWWTRANPTPL